MNSNFLVAVSCWAVVVLSFGTLGSGLHSLMAEELAIDLSANGAVVISDDGGR